MPEIWEILKTLADPTRLRLLRLLREESLSVAELQEILEMGQSRISTHLSVLRQDGLVKDRKEGKRTFYTLTSPVPQAFRKILEAAFESMVDSPLIGHDDLQLERVLHRRREIAESYFNEIAGRLGKNYCPGRSWEAICQFLLFLTPAIEIADLGAGEGLLAHLLAKRAKKVICVDNSPRMVEVGSLLLQQHGITNVEYKLGDIEEVPLPDRCVDLVFLSQALHHATHPQKAIREAVRILRPEGWLLILDLKEHHFEKARELYADTWLGFRESTLHGFLREAGLEQVEVRTIARETQAPYFETILGAGRKPA